MDYEILMAFAGATAALAISPGPDNIYVLIQGMVHGRKQGLAVTAGLMTGCLVHTTLLAIGMGVLIRESETLFWGIKLLGAGYMLFLAYKVYISSAEIEIDGGGVPKKSVGQLFRQGFIMNVLNPKVTLFFLAFFPGFLFSDTLAMEVQFYVLGFLFIIVSFIIFGTIAVLAGSISNYLISHKRIGWVLKWLQIVVFVGIALYLVFG